MSTQKTTSSTTPAPTGPVPTADRGTRPPARKPGTARGQRGRGRGMDGLAGKTGVAETGSDKIPASIVAKELFTFPGLLALTDVAEAAMCSQTTPEGRARPGVKSAYPAVVMLAVIALARVTRSQPSALTLLREDGVWTAIRDRYRAVTGLWLPLEPPNRDQMRYFRQRLTSGVDLMDRLHRAFTRAALGQALRLGNLRTGVGYDGACPSRANAIYGDGTRTSRFSDVTTFVHPGTGEILLSGSRATSLATAKIQNFHSDGTEDGKDSVGLNHVAMSTMTHSGRVVLSVGTALKAEAWEVLDQVDLIMKTLADIPGANPEDVHTLIYDRALTGWHVDYLMGEHGIQVLSKAVARNSAANRDEQVDPDELVQAGRRLAAEYGRVSDQRAQRAIRQNVVDRWMVYHEPIPVGVSVFEKSSRTHEVTYSTWLPMDTVGDTTESGTCEHTLVMDHGGVFEVELDPEAEAPVYHKTAYVPCQSSTRTRGTEGRWQTTNTYTVSCDHGDHTFERTWEPTGTRYYQGDGSTNRAPEDRLGWRLRPLSQNDDMRDWYNHQAPPFTQQHTPFGDVFGTRNDPESFNNWYQDSLPRYGRAASQTQAGQELDWLCGALTNNLITWITAQDTGLI